MKILLIITFLLLPGFSQAQDSSEGAETKVSTTRKKLKKKFFEANIDYMLWQETIDADGSASGDARFQFTGLRFGASYNIPGRSIRWIRQYSADFALGVTKGAGTGNTISDEFNNQNWFSAGFTPGMIYRTTAASEIGLIAPVNYRFISWALEPTAGFELDRQASFSVGLGGVFIQRFTPRSALRVSLVHQFLWEATQWSLGWQYSFKK